MNEIERGKLMKEWVREHPPTEAKELTPEQRAKIDSRLRGIVKGTGSKI